MNKFIQRGKDAISLNQTIFSPKYGHTLLFLYQARNDYQIITDQLRYGHWFFGDVIYYLLLKCWQGIVCSRCKISNKGHSLSATLYASPQLIPVSSGCLIIALINDIHQARFSHAPVTWLLVNEFLIHYEPSILHPRPLLIPRLKKKHAWQSPNQFTSE